MFSPLFFSNSSAVRGHFCRVVRQAKKKITINVEKNNLFSIFIDFLLANFLGKIYFFKTLAIKKSQLSWHPCTSVVVCTVLFISRPLNTICIDRVGANAAAQSEGKSPAPFRYRGKKSSSGPPSASGRASGDLCLPMDCCLHISPKQEQTFLAHPKKKKERK